MKNNNYIAALEYLDIGLSVIPVGKDKIPLIKWDRYQNERATKEQIEGWFVRRFPDANVGIVTGAVSGIVVIDVEQGGRINDLPLTARSRTGGGGWHYFYKHPGKFFKNTTRFGNLADKRDIRGDGGYIVAPPSLHKSGKYYQWIEPLKNIESLTALPMQVIEVARTGKNRKEKVSERQRIMNGVAKGGRNDAAAKIAGGLLVKLPEGQWESHGLPALRAWNAKCTPPLDETELLAVWESIREREKQRREDGDDPTDIKKQPQAELLVRIVTENPNVVLFHDENKEPFVQIPNDAHGEIWACDDQRFKWWLAVSLWDSHEKTINATAWSAAQNVIAGMACRGMQKELHNRVAKLDNDFYYDLTDGEWRAVKITATGWTVEANPPILFRRYPHQKQQVIPLVANGDAKKLLQFVNIPDDQHKLLLLVYIVSCFIPDIQHPLPLVYGQQGSAKSVLSKMIRRLVDPSLTEANNFPRDSDQLAQQLAHYWYLLFDNVSELPDWLSDTFCKAVSGDGFSKRKLYTNDGDVIYTFKRCIGINGINPVARKPDLLERSILFELERVPKSERKQEEKLWEQFEKEKSCILGGIFDVLSEAMKIKPTIQLKELPRMADFTVWGCAIAEAIGFTQKQFLDAYGASIKGQNDEVLAGSLIATVVRKFMEDQTHWEETPSKLLETLKQFAKVMGIDPDKERDWPKTANLLSRRLNELKTNLAEDGILVRRGEKNKERIIILEKPEGNTVATAEPPRDAQALGDSGNDTTDDDILPPLESSPEKSLILLSSGDSNDKNGDLQGSLFTCDYGLGGWRVDK